MKKIRAFAWKNWMALILFAILTITGNGGLYAQDQKEMGGWERHGAYDKHYNPSEYEKFRAWVIKVKEIVPMAGMSPGIALEVKESMDDDDIIVVHLCPAWYLDRDGISVKRGDRVKLKGAWAEIDGEDVFMAAKVIKGDYYEFKVRLTSNGKPFWTMDAQELEKERRSQ